MATIRDLFTFVYGEEKAAAALPRVEALIERYRPQVTPQPVSGSYFDERDAILITYGDSLRAPDEAPLRTLGHFLDRHVGTALSTVHLLPFFPYTSDDGFSVTDYRLVNPDLGTWNDIAALGERYKLMFDAVINHISAASDWFRRFKAGESPYTDYFITVPPETDLSRVFRPRALPLLTPVETHAGRRWVWTTFSADQIDLNFGSPDLLLDVLDVLLGYAAHGATLLRLDAIGFMWKEIGTTSIHLPEAHALIQLMRAVFDQVAPQVALVTETNVPHADNISYFGDGHNEAQMVYNFSLPPLVLHAFHTGDATYLTRWASSLDLPSDRVTFFNFLASHDGIGVTPARGILPAATIDALGQRVLELGGRVSYRTNADGSRSVYELNINYMDALGAPGERETADLIAGRFLAAQAIKLALRGVPGIYIHSLIGSRSWHDGVAQTGQNRTINREKPLLARVERELAEPNGLRRRVFDGQMRLLGARRENRAFHPNGAQRVLDLHPAVFAVERAHGGETVLCLTNVSNRPHQIEIPYAGTNLIDGEQWQRGMQWLPPYAIVWLNATSLGADR